MRAPNEPKSGDPCACTGVRWCARCLDPVLRQRRKMDDPVPQVPILAQRPAPPADPARARPPIDDGIHYFDPGTQSVPDLPDFRGVRVYRDFLSPAESRSLLTEIEATPFTPAQSGKAKQHAGPKINFNKRRMNASAFRGIPAYAHDLEARLRRAVAQDPPRHDTERAECERALAEFETTDVFVLRYQPAERSNLDFHLDDTFSYGELILDLSLESDAWLTFLRGRPNSEVPGADAQAERPVCVRVPMPARSIVALFGPARFEWEHAVLDYDIEARRTSVTLRTLSPTLAQTDAGQLVLERARGRSPDGGRRGAEQ